MEKDAAAGAAARDGDEKIRLADEASGEDGVAGDPGQQAEGDAAAALRQQATDNWNRYLRAVAELDNLRKRSAREIENAHKFGAERLAAALLPVRDSLEAALNAGNGGEAGEVDISALLEGERATLRLLDQAFAAVGIVEIDPEGEPFDPERHEAISLLPSPTAEPNSVIAVVQKGFALHERVVRPARVVVARAPGELDPS